MERARFKRTDYTKTEIRSQIKRSPTNNALEGVLPVTYQTRQTDNKPTYDQDRATQTPQRDKSTFSFNMELPNLRRPPDSGDVSKKGTKWALIIISGLLFFIIGYTALWGLTHRSTHISLNMTVSGNA